MSDFKYISSEDFTLSILEPKLQLGINYIEVKTPNTVSTIEAVSPTACDRGHFIWKVWSTDDSELTIDHCDMFPRYYFHIGSLQDEMIAWYNARKQRPTEIGIKVVE